MLESLLKYYSLESKIGEGSFSEVFKVRQNSTGQHFAAKRLTRVFANIEEVNDYFELKVLLKLQYHPNIILLVDYAFESECSRLTLIFNLMDLSLYDFIKDRKKKLSEIRCKNYLFQLGQGLFYLHHNGIFHRDIKPENCLLRIDPTLAKTNPLRAELIQIGDLGTVTYTSYPLPRSEYVSTRWYRSPECLLTRGYYGSKMDIWGLGCCFYEMVTLEPLFPGANEIDQLDKIHSIIGSPSKQVLGRFKNIDFPFQFPKKSAVNMHTFLPMLSLYGVDILKKALSYHPDNRITAKRLLEHVYFEDLKQKISGDAGTTRLLYSKPNSACTVHSRKSSLIFNHTKTSSFGSICSKTGSVQSQLVTIQQRLNHQLERNWNKPQASFK